MTCEETRRLIHEANDDGAPLPEPVREHVAGCDSCRELDNDLAVLTGALQALPRTPLPAETLDAVWRATIHARPQMTQRTTGTWRLAAAAVVATALAGATFYAIFAPTHPPQPSAVELARASSQADLVLGYTARALAATRIAATDQVLASRVSPAVRGIAATHPSRRP
jgi:predicted anti-sigma-YlaC factor YlaD